MKKITFIGVFLAAAFLSATVSFGQIIITENFEDYTVGGKIAQQAQAMSRNYWTTWSGTVGGAEDANVSNAQAHGGAKTINVLPGNDLVLKLGDQAGGAFHLKFFIYLPTGKSGYFNLLHKFVGADSEHAVEFYFNADGTGKSTINGADESFTHPKNTWIEVNFDIDLNADQAHVTIGSVYEKNWQWSLKAGGGEGLNELAAADFFGHEAACSYFIDDITFEQTEDAFDPMIAVTPNSITTDIDINTTKNVSIQINNTGQGFADYSTYIQYDLPAFAEGPTFDLTRIPDPSLFSYGGGIGHREPDVTYTREIAAKFIPDYYKNKNGAVIRKVRFFIGQNGYDSDNVLQIFEPGSDLTFRVYGQGVKSNIPGEVLAEKVLPMANFIKSDWNEVEFDTPVRLTGGEYWVSVEMLELANSFPLSYDDGSSNVNGYWIRTNGGTWAEVRIQGGANPKNWALVATCDGETHPSWATMPAYGRLMGATNVEVPIALDARAVSFGTYNASIIAASTDPVNPMFTIPLTMNVGGEVVCNPVQNLKAEMNTSTCQITVSWDAIPNGIFNVYRDGALVAENITNRYYRVALGFYNTYEWCVEQVCNGGISEKACVTNAPCKEGTGVSEIEKVVEIYPNPATSNVTISGINVSKVEIFNAVGQKVEEKIGCTTIDVANYNNGIYFFRIFDTENNVATKRIMIAK